MLGCTNIINNNGNLTCTNFQGENIFVELKSQSGENYPNIIVAFVLGSIAIFISGIIVVLLILFRYKKMVRTYNNL